MENLKKYFLQLQVFFYLIIIFLKPPSLLLAAYFVKYEEKLLGGL